MSGTGTRHLLHPKIAEARRSGAFNTPFQTFRDFEQRIVSNLASGAWDTVLAGTVFEVFAEAYIARSKQIGAKDVWPGNAIPPSVSDALSLGRRDRGVDGVYRGREGGLTAYQVKFRSGRGDLTFRELSTFLAWSDGSTSRLVFTNADSVSEAVKGRWDIQSVRAEDLDALDPEELEEIRTWVLGSRKERQRRVPKEHQEEALAAILGEFRTERRATAVMACGSGKTLIGLWAAERLGSTQIIFLAPSLALIRQTLAEWAKDQGWGDRFRFICVCSDDTVTSGLDELSSHRGDLSFGTTTSPERVAEFLKGHSDGQVSIVFSTYHSAGVVSEGMPEGFEFDLGVFDEAHKTAGAEGAAFALGLRDEVIPMRLRLFMTATRRVIRLRKGMRIDVFSMDNVDAYGKVVYRLSFREAAQRGVICPLRVLVSVLTDKDVLNGFAETFGEVSPSDDDIEDAATKIALAKAIEEYGLSKVFTFHHSVAEAKAFSESIVEQGLLPGFVSTHVTGSMSVGNRAARLAEFGTAQKGTISNARCLTEGVDVPAVDLVAFIDPKKSKVDIVQAVGRASRLADGKTHGYVLLPVLVSLKDGETVEEAVERHDFSDVWAVLHALMDDDEVLAEALLRSAATWSGESYFDAVSDIITVSGISINPDALKKAIGIKLVGEMTPALPVIFPPSKKEPVPGGAVAREDVLAGLEKILGCSFPRKPKSGIVKSDDGSNVTVHITFSDYRRGQNQFYTNVSEGHLAANYFVMCWADRPEGWVIPTDELGKHFRRDKIPNRKNGRKNWSPTTRHYGDMDVLGTNHKPKEWRIPPLHITDYRANFEAGEWRQKPFR